MDLNDDLEEGELSNTSDDVYTPLQRPDSNPIAVASEMPSNSTGNTIVTDFAFSLNDDIHQDTSSRDESSTSGGSSDVCITGIKKSNPKRKKRIRRNMMVRVPDEMGNDEEAQRRAKFKKYTVWTAAIEEDALTENMRGCDVTRSDFDRNVENYDFSLHRRLNGEVGALKRRLSNYSTDESSDTYTKTKRGRTSNLDSADSDNSSQESRRRRRVKSRLGHMKIVDLDDTDGRDLQDIAREMAKKLYEQKDELIISAVEVLGLDLTTTLFKETQRIESNGGMMIHDRGRRRTPGGVFLYLLKHHESLTEHQRQKIFSADKKNKKQKDVESMSRDEKVEELKKRLSDQERVQSSLGVRKDTAKSLLSDFKSENPIENLSNPPPSPVVGQGHSPEYKSQAVINHDIGGTLEKPCSSSTSAALNVIDTRTINSYADDLDILDVNNCAEMDYF